MHPAVRDWLLDIRRSDRDTAAQIGRAIQLVLEGGPGIGRPLVDTIRGSALANLKELRPGSAGRSEIRVLFVFDPERRMLLLVAGDKSENWRRWYDQAIPLAESRFAEMTKEG